MEGKKFLLWFENEVTPGISNVFLFIVFKGFMIFIFHCVLNSEVRKAFRRKKQIWSDSHLFQCHSVSPPRYESEMSKETKSTSNGMDKVSCKSHILIYSYFKKG